MNKTYLINVSLVMVIIGAMLIGAGIAYWQQGEAKGWGPELNNKFGQEIDSDYLIENMEIARTTHQDIVDNPDRWTNWIKAGVDHQDWVNIYGQVIEVLRSRQ